MGAGSLNQAVKAVAIARVFLAPTGINIAIVPTFNDVLINVEEKTAIHLLINIIK